MKLVQVPREGLGVVCPPRLADGFLLMIRVMMSPSVVATLQKCIFRACPLISRFPLKCRAGDDFPPKALLQRRTLKNHHNTPTTKTSTDIKRNEDIPSNRPPLQRYEPASCWQHRWLTPDIPKCQHRCDHQYPHRPPEQEAAA